MKSAISTPDVSIRSAVIAWQPISFRHDNRDAEPGDVAVFQFLDPRERAFAMTDGACWVDWADKAEDELIEALGRLKRVMVRDYGIAAKRIEAAFARIPEYRRHQPTRSGGENPH